MVNRRWDSTDSQTLIERFDSKNSIHITAFVAIIFGAFSLLPFLQGQGFLPTEPNTLYIFLMEVLFFPISVLYCLCRSFYYSMCAEKVKDHSELRAMEDEACEKSVSAMPLGVKQIVKFRQYFTAKTIVLVIIPVIYCIWFGIVWSILTLNIVPV